MSKQLLTDCSPFRVTKRKLLESSGDGKNTLLVSGVLQRAGVKNQNGRIYPKPILEREIKTYVDTFVKNKNALGELDHPDSSVVNLRNVSHNIKEIKIQGNDIIGVVEILNTPSGNILKSLFESGITVGISSRGLGSVAQIEEGTVEVQDDFELIAFDFVSNPSTPGAFLSPMNESVDRSTKNAKAMFEGEVCGDWCKAHSIVRDILIELQK